MSTERGVTHIYDLTVQGGVTKNFSYDDNGNCTGYTSSGGPPATYEYDAEDRLVAVSVTPFRTEFSYDGFGRRVKQVEKLNGQVTATKQFVWYGLQLAEERDGNNTVTRRYCAEGMQKDGSAKFFYTRDHLGTIREMTGHAGAIRARYDYDPYGRRSANLITSNPVEAELSGRGVVGCPGH